MSRGRPKSGRRPLKRRRSDFWGIVGVATGAVFFALCVVFIVGAYYMVGILAEIAQKDYTPANERISDYEQFFDKARQHRLEVAKSTPYIKEGVKYFLWTISIPGRADKLVYRWKHDLETNRVEPLTSPATYVDIEMGYVRQKSAGLHPYDPNDTVALQIAKGTYTPPGFLDRTEEPAEPEPEEEAEAIEDEEVIEETPEEEAAEEVAETEGEIEEPPAESESVDIGGEPQEPESGEEAEEPAPPGESVEDENGAEDEPPEETPPDEIPPNETPPGGGDDAVPIG